VFVQKTQKRDYQRDIYGESANILKKKFRKGLIMIETQTKKSKTIAICGPTPEQIPFPLSFPDSEYQKLLADINIAVLHSIHIGYDTFLVGMEKGFDILCGETVQRLREIDESFSEIKLIGVLPNANYVPSFNEEWKTRYDRLLHGVNDIVILSGENGSEKNSKGIFLVDNADALLCYYGGGEEPVGHTLRYAVDSGLRIINMAQKRYTD
jgi:uncharacterized phage-like protein YoqJ